MKKYSRKTKIFSCVLIFTLLLAALCAPQAMGALYDSDKIASPYAVVYNVENDTFIFEKGADEIICCSSTAKLMTAILALEHFSDLSVSVTAVKDSLNGISQDKFKIGIKTDEEVTVKDLIYTMLIGNCTDSAAVLSYAVAGSHGEFGKMMNAKAKELGLTNTTYNSATGVGADINYYHTTVRDSVLLAAYAMKNPKIAEIVNTVKYTPESVDKPINEIVRTRNALLSTFIYGEDKGYLWTSKKCPANGVSINYSEESGYSLISSTNYKSLTYICMCSGAFENTDKKISAYSDVKKLLLWAADEYTTMKVLDKSQIFGEIPVKLSDKSDYVVVVPRDSLYAFLPHDTDVASTIRQEFEITEKELSAPVAIGQKVGTVRLYLGEKEIASCDLVAKTQIEKSGALAFLSVLFSKNMIIGIGIALVASALFGIIRFSVFLRMAKPRKPKTSK